jgi:hypothetical protein
MAVRKPFNLKQWINENRDLLKPPVGNKNLYADAGDYIVMIVAGPNAQEKIITSTKPKNCFISLKEALTCASRKTVSP